MDWGEIISSIMVALMFAIGLPLALRKRKKAGPRKLEQFSEHLQATGALFSPRTMLNCCW